MTEPTRPPSFLSHESKVAGLIISPTDETIGSWSERDFLPESLRDSISKADILILPQMGFRDFDKPVFPVGTESLIATLKAFAQADVNIDICIGDDDYIELALHSDLKIIGKIAVTFVAVPLLVNILSGYIYDRLLKSSPDANIRLEIVISGKDKSTRLQYEGPGRDFKENVAPMLNEEAKRLQGFHSIAPIVSGEEDGEEEFIEP